MSGPLGLATPVELTSRFHRMLNIGIATNVNGFPEFHDVKAIWNQ
jgi:hypothetical protein